MSELDKNSLSFSQQNALSGLKKRINVAKKRSSRVKTIIFFGPVTELDDEYLDLKSDVATALTIDEGELVDFQNHRERFLESIGLVKHPSRLEAPSLVNYIYELCEVSKREFVVVNNLNTILRILAVSKSDYSQQILLFKRLNQVMFSKPVVIVFPLFSQPGWISREQILEILGSESKWVYLEPTAVDKAYIKEQGSMKEESISEEEV